MTVDLDPSVSYFISELRKVPVQNRSSIAHLEMKKMANNSATDEDQQLIDIWKKYYLLISNFNVKHIDFIKSCASNCLTIKRIGYQALSRLVNEKDLILLLNTLKKDIASPLFVSEALMFISNVRIKSSLFEELVENMAIPSEEVKYYKKFLVTKAKYDQNFIFSLVSHNDSNLMVKLQIILDSQDFKSINSRDILYLQERFKKTTDFFAKLKILQLFTRLIQEHSVLITPDFLNYLKTYIIKPGVKSKKQIEIGLCCEVVELILASGNYYQEAEDLVLRMIMSDRPNSRYLGFKIVIKYGVLLEKAIAKILDLGIDDKLNYDTLLQLINIDTFNHIFNRLDQLKCKQYTSRLQIKEREKKILFLLEKMCNFGDAQFISKALLYNPNLYNMIRNKQLLSKEEMTKVYNLVVFEKDSQYFKLVYDFCPKSVSSEEVLEIAQSHFKVILSATENRTSMLFELFNFLCNKGDPYQNRDFLIKEITNVKGYKSLEKAFVEGILQFNLICKRKLIHIKDIQFIEFELTENNAAFSFKNLKETVEIPEFNIKSSDINYIENQSDKTIATALDGLDKATIKLNGNVVSELFFNKI